MRLDGLRNACTGYIPNTAVEFRRNRSSPLYSDLTKYLSILKLLFGYLRKDKSEVSKYTFKLQVAT
jgi:hypothetical protein